MWNNDPWDNDWKHDNDNWSHWDSASGVRVSVLACLLAGAAGALSFPRSPRGALFPSPAPQGIRRVASAGNYTLAPVRH